MTESSDGSRDGRRAFRVPMMFHPTLDTLNLQEAELWFERVFARQSVSLAKLIEIGGLAPRPNYSKFTLISDVYFDTVNPKLHIVNGVHRPLTGHEPHLRRFTWYIDGIEGSDPAARAIDGMNEAYRACKRHGIRIINQLGEVMEGDEAPLGRWGSKRQIFFTMPEDTGLSYSLCPPVPVPKFDPRTEPGWVTPEVSDDDPLTIECCSHHTVLMSRPEPALKLLCDVLDGRVIHEGRNALLGAACIYVHLAGSTIECAVPDQGTPAHEDWIVRAPIDTYHAITWKVADLARVERHLEAQGVRVRARSHDAIITDPATSLGIPWGFSSNLILGDPRH